MINILLFDTDKLIELHTTICEELKRRQCVNNSLTKISSTTLLVKGAYVKSKTEDIWDILGIFGRCSFEHTSSVSELMFYFDDERDLRDLMNSKDTIIKKIDELFINNFKGTIHLSRTSRHELTLSKSQILLQARKIYEILSNYGRFELTNSSSLDDLIVDFNREDDLDDLIKDTETVINKIQRLFL